MLYYIIGYLAHTIKGEFMSLIILCIKIYFARILDVSLNTVRTMMIVRNNKKWSCLIAFFEVIIWFYSASYALSVKNNSLIVAIFYALGYATGTFIGTTINNHFVLNNLKIEILTTNNNLIKYLEEKNYSYYSIKTNNNQTLISINISLKEYKKFSNNIKQFNVDNITLLKRF